MTKKELNKKIEVLEKCTLNSFENHKAMVWGLLEYLGLTYDIKKEVVEDFWSGDKIVEKFIVSKAKAKKIKKANK